MSETGIDFSADHFALFALPRQQALDEAALDQAFRQLQAQVHPDRHARADDAQRRLAMQWSTRVNEAYQTLKSPLRRARYLLTLLGCDPEVENNTAMPADFLLRQMELRETVAECHFHYQGTDVRITVSAGLTLLRDGESDNALFQRADQALLRAKKSGRNRCEVDPG